VATSMLASRPAASMTAVVMKVFLMDFHPTGSKGGR
jgi:hypothetical protein